MIDVEKLLNHLGIEYIDIGNDFRVQCWYHAENKPSMTIHKDTGMYHCFSCNESGSILKLVKEIENIDYVEAKLFLNNFANNVLLTPEQELEEYRRLIRKEKEYKKEHSVELIPNVRLKSNKYLVEKRGLYPKEIQYWDFRLSTQIPYKNWILVPIIYRNILRSYFLRNPNGSNKKYAKGNRSDVVFGYDKVITKDCIVGITEGIFDMIFARRIGLDVLSILSNRILDQQVEVLKEFKEIVIFPDNDENEAGLELVKSAKALMPYTTVSIAELPLDVGDCADNLKYSNEQLLNLTKEAFYNRKSISEFITSERYLKWAYSKHYDRISNRRYVS